MLPAGEITKMVMNDCLRLLKVGDILIDGGNSKYSESKKHNAAITAKGITFFDVGTSGGVSGARHGACMMIGGNREVFQLIEPIFANLSNLRARKPTILMVVFLARTRTVRM